MESESHHARPGRAKRRLPPVAKDIRTPNAVAATRLDGQPIRLVNGHAGDHTLVHALLRAANQAPSYEDFITWLDDPSYEPSDRLLAKQNNQIIAHVQLSHRTACFDGVKLPIGGLQDLAVLPEYAQAGCQRVLLSTAEQSLRDAGAIVSLVRADRPEPFRAAGWSDVRAGGYSQVSVSDLLAHLSAQGEPRQRRVRSLRIRRWRHVELDGVRPVYASAAARHWGALYRPEAYWRWLVGRKAHSDLIVAVEGADEWDDLEHPAPIVGYAVAQRARVLELCSLPRYARVAPRLLVRACHDAIERDHHTISLHTPASDPLHELIVTAGGTWCTDERGSGGTLLVKLLDPVRWVEAIYPILRRRAKAAGLPRPLALCFDAGHEHYRLVITRRSSRLVADEAMAADVRCDPQTFAALLVGNVNIALAREAGSIDVTDEDALHRLTVLFPPALFWQSQFDLLRF
jgi:predicted acetyltransferase